MFSILNGSTGSPRVVNKETYDLLFNVYNAGDPDALAECLEDTDVLEIYRMLEEINKELASVKLENLVLSDFLQKNDNKLLVGLDNVRKNSFDTRKASIRSQSQQSQSPGILMQQPRGARSRATSIAESSGRSSSIRKTACDYRVNYKTKIEMAEKLATEISKKCEALQAKGTHDVRILKGQIEEQRYQLADTEETLLNFKSQFVFSEAPLESVQTATEKQKEAQLRKFINNWLKKGRALLGTMRLKITSIQELCNQQRTALISKADLSGMLGPVDFEQLQIKREVQTRSLEEKNISLAGLKEVTGKASLSLAKEKKALMAVEQKSKILQEKTADFVKGIAKLVEESRLVEKEVEDEEEALETIKQQVEQYEAPSITDYILKKQDLIALEKEEKLLQRKTYIQNIKYRNMIRKLRAKNEMK